MKKIKTNDLEGLYYFLRGLGKTGTLAEFLDEYGDRFSRAEEGQVITIYDFKSPFQHISKVEVLCGLEEEYFRVLIHTVQEYNVDFIED